uniref:Membrane protein m121 n=1 Tax=Mastomys natalensis cytomegalovirus 1 TaxID=2973541 RepID=A0A9Y1N7R0_9BETA|nr:membrane protein m121 [Mastomys natalensis cytomegalovirus 1]WEG71203.1 membrane protein m121 [Mastomys natalensis cytomegalovirus 1]
MFYITLFTCIVIHTCTLCTSTSTDTGDTVADVSVTFTVHGDKCVSEHEIVSCEISSDGEGRRVRISHADTALTCQLNNSVSSITVKRRNVSRHRDNVTCSEHKKLLAELYSLMRDTSQIICLKCLSSESVTTLVYAILNSLSTGDQSIYNSKPTHLHENGQVSIPLTIVSNGIQPPSRAINYAAQTSAPSISGTGAVAEDQEKIPQTEKIRSLQRKSRSSRDTFGKRSAVSTTTDTSSHPDENSMRDANAESPTATEIYRLRRIWYPSRRSDTTIPLSNNNDSYHRSELYKLGRHPDYTSTSMEVHKPARDGPKRAILSKISHSHTSTYDVQTPNNDLSIQTNAGIPKYPTADGIQYKSTDSDVAGLADGRSTDTRNADKFASTQRNPTVSGQVYTRRAGIAPARGKYHRRYSRSVVQTSETETPSTKTETSTVFGYALRNKRAAGDGGSDSNFTTSDSGTTHLYTHKPSNGVEAANASTDSKIISGVTSHSIQPDVVSRTERKSETYLTESTDVTATAPHIHLTTGQESTFPIIDILGKPPLEQHEKTSASTPTRDVEEITTEEPIRRWVVTHPPFLLITTLTAAGLLVWLSTTLLVSLMRRASSVHYYR